MAVSTLWPRCGEVIRLPTDPLVTVVTPVFDGASEVGQAITSVREQTNGAWRLLVVDDQSSDGSQAAARKAAGEDPRVRILAVPHGGVSKARNAGLACVATEWVLFLDHDDWLSPSALERLLETAGDHPEADCIFGGWSVIAETGAVEQHRALPHATASLASMATHCPFPVHCAITRTARIREVGAFDPTLSTCEDWDLWLRLVRAGAVFVERAGELVWYRLRAGSMSTSRQMLTCGLRVIDRAFAPDDRVIKPAAEYREGAPTRARSGVRIAWAAYAAGLAIGVGQPVDEMLLVFAEAPEETTAALESLAYELFQAVPRARGASVGMWWRAPAEIRRCLNDFLLGLDALIPEAGALARIGRVLEDLIFADGTQSAAGEDAPAETVLGRTMSVVLDLASPVRDLCLPDGIDRVHCRPRWHDQHLVAFTLPASDGFVPAAVFLDACLANNAWPVAQALMRGGANASDDWETFMREVWGQPTWPQAAFYALGRQTVAAPANLEVRPGAPVVIDVCNPAANLITADKAVNIEVRVAGEPFLRLQVEVKDGRLTAQELIVAISSYSGFELCRAVVRRILRSPQRLEGSLREALVHAAAQPITTVAGWRVGQRRHAVPGTASFRAIVLPRPAQSDIEADAYEHGEPVIPGGAGDEPVLYDPTLLGAQTGAVWPPSPQKPAPPTPIARRHTFESVFAASRDPWSYASPYEVAKYRQTLELVPADTGRVLELGCAGGHFTRRLAEKVAAVDAVDISELALVQARGRCADLGNITFRRADLFADRLGSGYDCVVCSEVLYYAEDHDVLQATISSMADALRPGGLLVTAHLNALIDDPSGPGFDWDLPFGAFGIERAMVADGRLRLERERSTDMYRIQAFRRRRRIGRRLARDESPSRERVTPADVLPEHVRASFRPKGGAVHRAASKTNASTLPILMYHRVAPTGAAAARRWRVTPEELERQLAYLRSAGYWSITLSAWRDAVVSRRQLEGKPIVLTFDDGYADFEEHARPLLERYSFTATLFVVTDCVGSSNVWDRALETTPLMSWHDLRRLAALGFEVGGHTATHQRLTGLSDAEVVHEVSRSRRALDAELSVTAKLFASPYGLRDSGIDALIGGCGFEVAVTVEHALATLDTSLLRLPRLEVSGGMDLESFVRLLGV